MQGSITAILPALLLIGCLECCHGADDGCTVSTGGCCLKCKPGYREQRRCAPDPKQQCVPCEAGTYIQELGRFTCFSCTQCTSTQTVKQACTSTSDTVCGCVHGYRCVDAHCSGCMRECNQGEEPTGKESCRTCPDGTFSNQIHQNCTPWRTSCPHPGHGIVALGTAFHDSICGNASSDDGQFTWLMVSAVIACLSGLVIIGLACAYKIKMRKNKQPAKKPPAERRREVEQEVEQEVGQEAGSLCHPQQEEGGSLCSNASKGSEEKLLPV
ncbi:hypothetical protein SKAU_G00114130 [Synaphobranchus kaupii]|uniref:TNFR-Cys domain-containing protein n=1 Tax=Synaphobranchus kaupii TaxID=118154 RepID=A0A9Q1J6I5_SYNKA|nr:hypothetical protein SKAU_G00114130 [Synaphobranchus kaupii]